LLNFLRRAAEQRILVKDGRALESLQDVDTVVFDKTGTLTEGRPEVAEVLGEPGLLARVASAQQGSEHPLGRAIVRAVGKEVPGPESFRALPGRGLEAVVGGQQLAVGSARLMDERGVDRSEYAARAAELEASGATVVWASSEGRCLGAIALQDRVRDGARGAIERLKALGVEPVLLTGDNRAAAERVGGALGIGRVVAEVLPEDKVAEVEHQRAGGRTVAMVGDGVNDGPALAAADVGFAMGSGSDVAMEAAGVTLVRPAPELVADAIDVARRTHAKIRQNLFWAFAYNVVGIPLAMAGVLTPALAGGAMAMSSVSVVSNALLLGRWKAST
ncbi:MAG: HAD-IC family P-type ATPase, partial [Myxococcales bacterium]|nr:HAD-IC family P-type ATPase [Myxococcales bacterium]